MQSILIAFIIFIDMAKPVYGAIFYTIYNGYSMNNILYWYWLVFNMVHWAFMRPEAKNNDTTLMTSIESNCLGLELIDIANFNLFW